MPLYGYNYPWSGKLGRVSKHCLYCGHDGYCFDVSYFGERCTHCIDKTEAIPELVKRYNTEMQHQAKVWCDNRGIDYDGTIANYFKHLGPQFQERDDPIPNAEKDYTIYKHDHHTQNS